MNKRLFISTLLVCISFFSIAQDFSNKGKDFWVGYGTHCSMYTNTGVMNTSTGGTQNLVLYFTSDQTANVTITIPATGWTKNYTVAANTVVTSDIIPKIGTDDARLGVEGVSNKGIHVVSDKPIVAYAHIYDGSISGATLLFPTTTLGQDYYTLGMTQTSNQNYSYPFAYVIATEDNTLVEVTPSANTQTHTAGIPFTQVLQKGQILNLLGQITGQTGVDLTGTRIRSVSNGTAGGCKKIAVYCGTGKIYITCNNSSGSADNTIQQVFPASAWGKKYFTAPTAKMPNNIFRVMVNDPTTIVKRNGVILTGIINNRYYQFQTNTADLIESDKPTLVAQFITTREFCGNPRFGNIPSDNYGDPEMIYLSPVEQTIDKITLNSTPNAAIGLHYINVVIKTSAIPNFRLDATAFPANFITHPQDPTYSYAQFLVGAGSHSLSADSGFNAIAYGYGNAESYGYNAGANVRDLYQYVSLQNQYATVNFPSTCKNTPFFFSITLPYLPTSLIWDFSTNPNLLPNATITTNTPTPDSIFVKDGKTLYVFKLPGTYTFSAIGTYPIKVIANNPTPDGCSGTQEITYDVIVYDQPIADWSYTHTGCLSDSVKFFDTGNGFGRQFIKWSWTFGDGGVDSIKNPIKKYAAAGTYNVRLKSITDIGCIADTTKPITLAAQPTAKFKVSDTTCAGNTITYKDSSYINGGTIVKWYWDLGNGTQLTNLTNADVTAIYPIAGPYTVTLQVENNTGCKSVVFSKVVNIRPKPVPDFILPIAVCLPDGTASFTNATTISDATQATITYLWSFGNGSTSTLLNPSTTYTNVGPFNVQLTATSIYGCVKDTVKVLSTIYPRPTADFTVSPEVCFKDTTLFNDVSNGNGSQVVKWRWSFGDATTDTIQNPKHLYLTTNSTYTVKLFVYTDKGCISDTMTKTTLVNPLPTASFTNTSPLCEINNIGFTPTSIPNVGNINSWYWDMGNGVVNNFANANTFNQAYATWGTYTVKHMVQTDKGCKSDTLTKVLIVRPLPKPDFTLPIAVCLPVGTASFTNATTISDATQATITYLWSFGNGNTSTLLNPTTTYTNVGPFNVQLTATSVYGCVKDTVKVLSTIYPRPTADFTVSPEVCFRDTTLFTDVSNGNGSPVVKWRWSFGDATTDTIQNPKHRYLTTNNTFTVKLFVYTDKGCISDTMTKTTVVNPLPTANFTFSSPTCETKAITFTDNSTIIAGTLTRWQWNMGNAIIHTFTNANSFTETYATANTYTVKLMTESAKGCKSDTTSKPIIIRSQPVANFIVPEVCLNDTYAQFLDSSYIADGTASSFSYSWNFGDANSTITNPNTSTLKNPTHKYTATGPYTVTLKVTSNNGCATTIQKAFFVNGSFPVSDFLVQNSSTLCSNTKVSIQNKSTVFPGNITKVEIYWDFANNPAIKDTDDIPTYDKIYQHQYANFQSPLTKTYTIRFVAYSGGSCANIKTQTITINASPKVLFQTLPGICFEASPRQITQASEVGAVPGASPAFAYFGSGVSSIGLFSPAIAGVGTFPIKYVYTSNKGCQDSATKPITVWPSPTAKFGFSIPTCEKNDVTFTDSSLPNYSNIIKWDWNFGNTITAIKTNNNPFTYKYSAASITAYNATLKVTTDSGCVSLIKTVPVKVNYLPLVSFTNPSICLPDGNGTFNNTSTISDNTQNQFSYFWNFGDGGTDNVKNPTHKFTAVGPFTIKLKITSVDGCIDSLSKQITTIYPQPHADFTINPFTKDVCIGKPFGFTNISTSSNGAITSWNWNYGDGSPIVTVQNPIYTYTASNNFTVSLFTYDAKGCVSDTMQKTVTVHAKPVAIWGYTSPTCEKNAITFSDTSIANFASISKWNWTFGDGSSASYFNNVSFPKTYAAYNNYTATLQVMSDTGCFSIPVSKIIKVNPLPRVDFSIPNICLPDGNGTFSDLSTIPDGTQSQFSYAWNFGDGGTDIIKNPTHQYLGVGPYNVQLKVTSIDGCIDSITKPINTIYPQPHADFIISPASGEVCIGAPFSFTDASTSSNGSINSWQWTFGNGGGQSTIKNPTYTYNTANTFNVKLFAFDSKGCVTDTMTKPVTVHAYPVVDAGPSLFVLQDGTGKLLATATGNNLQYAWSPTTYLDSLNVLRPTIIYPQNDITYKLTVTALGGCAKTDTVSIKVLKTPQIPNAFSPNSDGINDRWDIKYLESYPGATIEVFNRYGQKVFSSVGYSTPWDGSFKGSPLPVATYYYIVNPGNGRKQYSGSVTILK